MFHLLVSFSGWPNSGGTMSNNRIYLKPHESPDQSFFLNGKLDISNVSKIPALLVTEPGGSGEQHAQVAYITSLSQGLKETAIQYAIDNNIHPVSNKELENFKIELGLGNFGLSHTCWRLCSYDLFKLLLIIQQNCRVTPKVFSLKSRHEQEEKLVSVMMPFKMEFNSVYAALKTASSNLGYKCIRADDIWEHHTIIQDVVNLISKARVVICDCSEKNPNVFYEAGIAHAIGKEVILITRSHDDIPFDLRHLRYITYLPNNEGLQDLTKNVQSRLSSIMI